MVYRSRPTPQGAKTHYILTMRGTNEKDPDNYVESMVVDEGKIKYVGSNEGAMAFIKAQKYPSGVHFISTYVNPGTILMPGFIDPHAHIAQQTSAYGMIDLSPKPYGDINTMKKLYDTMYLSVKGVKDPTALIVGNNYDDARLQPMKHPRREDLDLISGKHPMYLIHTSGHMGVANTAMMNLLGFMKPDTTVEGGTIVREHGKPTGLLTENANIAALGYIFSHAPISKDTAIARMLRAEKLWFANGLTTVCEGRCDPQSLELIHQLNDKGALTADFIVLPDFDSNKDNLAKWQPYYNNYDAGYHHFKIGGVKFTFDGSPQGRDAWLVKPYTHPPTWESADFNGDPIYPDTTKLKEYVGKVFDMGMSVNIHCNGDSAIEEGLNVIESVIGRYKAPLPNVIIHTQMCTSNQIQRLKKDAAFLMPSFFPTHTYIWGAWHRDVTIGPDRARRISPCKEALDNNIVFTIHTDAPVTPPDMLTAAYSAVNRTTLMDPTPTVLGPEQRLDGYNALKAMTINAAIQWGEQSTKGTFEKDKRADMILVSGDPLKIQPGVTTILQTYKDGKLVYSKKAANNSMAKTVGMNETRH